MPTLFHLQPHGHRLQLTHAFAKLVERNAQTQGNDDTDQ